MFDESDGKVVAIHPGAFLLMAAEMVQDAFSFAQRQGAFAR